MPKLQSPMSNSNVFCPFRRKNVALTPEEYVRQNFLRQLVEQYHYPASLIAVEKALPPIQQTSGNTHRKRADAIVYSSSMLPLMIIEFKADSVPLTRETLDQIAVYNTQLNVPYLVLHNGRETVIARVQDSQITFLDQLPEWNQLSH